MENEKIEKEINEKCIKDARERRALNALRNLERDIIYRSTGATPEVIVGSIEDLLVALSDYSQDLKKEYLRKLEKNQR